MSYTLAQLRTLALARSDMPTGFIDVATQNAYINQAAEELVDYLVLAWEDYFMSSFQFTLSGSTDGYTMPDVVYKLRGIDRQITSPNTWATVKRYAFKDRNQFRSPFGILNGFYQNVQFNWFGDTIQFVPKGQSAGTYQVWYTPVFTQLDDIINPNLPAKLCKFADYIITAAAIKFKDTEESDTTVLMMQLQGLQTRIKNMAPNKDNSMPQKLGSWVDAERGGRFGNGGY